MKTIARSCLLLFWCTVFVYATDSSALSIEKDGGRKPSAAAGSKEKAAVNETAKKVELLQPKRGRVQILSAIYGTAGKNADVTAKVKDWSRMPGVRFPVIPSISGRIQTLAGTKGCTSST